MLVPGAMAAADRRRRGQPGHHHPDPLGGVVRRSALAPAGLQGRALPRHRQVDVRRRRRGPLPRPARAPSTPPSTPARAAAIAPDESYQDRPLWGTGATTGAGLDRPQAAAADGGRALLPRGRRLAARGLHRLAILERGASPYQDHKGRPDCPIEAQSRLRQARQQPLWPGVGHDRPAGRDLIGASRSTPPMSAASASPRRRWPATRRSASRCSTTSWCSSARGCVEFWRPNTNAGPTDPAFTPNLSSSFQRGCASRDTIAFADNSLFWVGDNRVVYRVGDVPARSARSSIEDKLRQCPNIAGCTAFVATFEGHEFYVLNIPGVGSYAYDISRIGTTAGAYGDSYERGEWSEWRSFGRHDLPGPVRRAFNGAVLIGDDTTNDVGAMQTGTLDRLWRADRAASPRPSSRSRRAGRAAPPGAARGDGRRQPGRSRQPPVAEMRYSDDQGRTFGRWRAAPLGRAGALSRPRAMGAARLDARAGKAGRGADHRPGGRGDLASRVEPLEAGAVRQTAKAQQKSGRRLSDLRGNDLAKERELVASKAVFVKSSRRP